LTVEQREQDSFCAGYDAARATAILTSGALVDADKLVREAKRAEYAADVWDETCQAFAWALANGDPGVAVTYVVEHNPYRKDEA
jgi:hypothetical protein